MKIYTGHLEYHGLDVLLTVFEDGTHTISVRHGADERWNAWGAPVEMLPHTADVTQ